MRAFKYTMVLSKKIEEAPVTDLQVSVRAHNALRRNKILTIGQLVENYYRLRELKNCGALTTSEIKRELFCWYMQRVENKPDWGRFVDSMRVDEAEHPEALL